MNKAMAWGFAAVFAMSAGTTDAQQAPRDSDTLLTQDELTQLVSGQVMEFYDGSQAFYLTDGAYQYRYTPTDPPFLGTYTVSTESSVCVAFDNGFNRCDLIVNDGKRYVMIIANGDRYPVRSMTAIN